MREAGFSEAPDLLLDPTEGVLVLHDVCEIHGCYGIGQVRCEVGRSADLLRLPVVQRLQSTLALMNRRSSPATCGDY